MSLYDVYLRNNESKYLILIKSMNDHFLSSRDRSFYLVYFNWVSFCFRLCFLNFFLQLLLLIAFFQAEIDWDEGTVLWSCVLSKIIAFECLNDLPADQVALLCRLFQLAQSLLPLALQVLRRYVQIRAMHRPYLLHTEETAIPSSSIDLLRHPNKADILADLQMAFVLVVVEVVFSRLDFFVLRRRCLLHSRRWLLSFSPLG